MALYLKKAGAIHQLPRPINDSVV